MTGSTTAESTHHEVEIKLDADPAFALPDLAGLTGVTAVEPGERQDLEASYLDSADLGLVRHGTTLRRRTGGPDAGWHLKLPAAKRGRIEVHRPLGESGSPVPADLLGLVRVQLRGRPVELVARISTRRTVHRLIGEGGRVLAEVADDLVTAEALGAELTTSSWREIEVELRDGDEALLAEAGDVLLAAGARPSDASSKLSRTLGRRLAELDRPVVASRPPGEAATTAGRVAIDYVVANLAALIAEDPRVRLDQDDAVHQMRVATRRLRTALATFRPLFVEGAAEPLRDELKWIGGVLGVARDAEVMRDRLTAEIAALPVELVLGPVQRRVDLELGRAYQEGHADVVAALDGDRYLALVAALEAFIAEPPLVDRGRAAAKGEVRRLVRRAGRRVLRAVAELDGVDDQTARDVQLHQVRITAKRLRYAAEAVRPVAGPKAKRLADQAEQIQETLGNHQDAVVQREWLRDLAVRAFLAGENGFTFGLLHGRTEVGALHDEQQFAAVWKQARRSLANWPGKN